MARRGMNISSSKPNKTFFYNEGTATYYETVDTVLGPVAGVLFAQRGDKGTEVQIDTTYDMTVEPLTSGVAVGRVTSADPEGALPKSTKTEGNYTMRRVRVEVDGEIDRLELADTHAAITPGDCLAVDRTDKKKYVKEEDTTTNLYALQAKDSNEGGFIIALRKRGPSQMAAD